VNSPHSDFFVVDKDGHLLGVVTINDVRKILYQSEDLNSLALAYDLLTPIHHYFTPEDSLDIIMKAFSEMNIDELPVVNNEYERNFIGTISKNDVIEIYNNEMLKRDTVSSVSSYISSFHKLNHVKIIDGQVMSEIEIPAEFIDKTLRELSLRNRFGVEVVLIKQKSDKKEDKTDIVFPNPDYRFKPGDSILILGSPAGLKNFPHDETE
jgi:K+/H+ antiporter YhaU regulatory subunit KhtT